MKIIFAKDVGNKSKVEIYLHLFWTCSFSGNRIGKCEFLKQATYIRYVLAKVSFFFPN